MKPTQPREIWFAVPGDLATLTGGYIYARCLIDSLRTVGCTVHVLALPDDFPSPSQETLAITARLLRTLPHGATVLFDGLAFGALPAVLLESLALDLVALVHHPLARETGLSPEAARALHTMEKAALGHARRVIATSAHTADVLTTEYDVAPGNISVARPGVERGVARAPGTNETPCLLTVATLTPRKGLDVLVAALAQLHNLVWASVIVGSAERAPATAAALHAQIAEAGLTKRITLAGTVSEAALRALYTTADIFVLPSRYEGYGMAFADALAHGLPIVGCQSGAVIDTVPADAALLVPVDDADALANALRSLIIDPKARKQLGGAAWRAGHTLPRWEDTARAVAQALEMR